MIALIGLVVFFVGMVLLVMGTVDMNISPMVVIPMLIIGLFMCVVGSAC